MIAPREIILKHLRERPTEYISGEHLSATLSLSRTAIWKHIHALQKEGYKIRATPRLGYRLMAVPDLLLPVEITHHLRTQNLGKKIYYYEKIDSTNDLAKELATAGAPEGTLVVAEEQSHGRGRLDRKWISPPGGIWLSLILRPPINPVDASKIALTAAISLVEAVKEIVGIEARIKWPNDVLIHGKKVAGILTEMEAELDKIHSLILGIGINANFGLNRFPPEIRGLVTTLRKEFGRDIPRVVLLARILDKFEDGYSQLVGGESKFLLEKWRWLDEVVGKEVKAVTAEGILIGRALGIDEHGALILQTESGEEKHLLAGEVTLAK